MDEIMAEIKQLVIDERCKSYEEGYREATRDNNKYSAEKLYDAIRLILDDESDFGMPFEDIKAVFGVTDICFIMQAYNAKTIIDKIEEYKEKLDETVSD